MCVEDSVGESGFLGLIVTSEIFWRGDARVGEKWLPAGRMRVVVLL